MYIGSFSTIGWVSTRCPIFGAIFWVLGGVSRALEALLGEYLFGVQFGRPYFHLDAKWTVLARGAKV